MTHSGLVSGSLAEFCWWRWPPRRHHCGANATAASPNVKSSIVHSLTVPVRVLLVREGVVVEANSAAQAMFGRASLHGLIFDELVTAMDDTASVVGNASVSIVTPDGIQQEVELGRSDVASGTVIILRDVSGNRLEAEPPFPALDTVGQIAGGIALDF